MGSKASETSIRGNSLMWILARPTSNPPDTSVLTFGKLGGSSVTLISVVTVGRVAGSDVTLMSSRPTSKTWPADVTVTV